MTKEKIDQALQIIKSLGLPREQHNERSALCLLALLNLTPEKEWKDCDSPLIGITPIMDFARQYYGRAYAPNTRETFRRQTMHQFVDAGIALYNPDEPTRPVNSPKAVYQIAPEALSLIRTFGTKEWGDTLLIYAGDTGEKWGYFDSKALNDLGVEVDSHGKMPDVVLYWSENNWLILVESVTSHGPVNPKRHAELARLFESSTADLVFVTAFPTRSIMSRYLGEIAWETEVWVADAPSHMIHFNGERFLGPY